MDDQKMAYLLFLHPFVRNVGHCYRDKCSTDFHYVKRELDTRHRSLASPRRRLTSVRVHF